MGLASRGQAQLLPKKTVPIHNTGAHRLAALDRTIAGRGVAALMPAGQATLAQPAYASCYCEENVYLLALQLETSGIDRKHIAALFITSIVGAPAVPVWRQRSAAGPDGLALWDYHVVLLLRQSLHGPLLVYDLDSSVQFC